MSATTNSLFSGVDDFVGGLLNSDIGKAALDIYKQKTAADIANDQAKAVAKIEADRARAAAAAAQTAANAGTGGAFGMSSQTLLYAGAGIVAVGLVIWAATRRA